MPDSHSPTRTPLKHLLICREYPPAPYPAGGIGTYARQLAGLLAEAGEIVHVLAQRWQGAPEPVVLSHGGRLSVHRLVLEQPLFPTPSDRDERAILSALANSACPAQVFSWQAARYAEHLIVQQGIDIIEAQEWEAPLYYLQLRRALGLGPQRQPPCIVHLHSPTQRIFEHNQWDQTLIDFLPLTRCEQFTVQSADALVCPSQYLAHDAAALFGFDPSSVTVTPYPVGNTPLLSRTANAWARNHICYVGRLELRKGVVEWIDAAILVSATHHSVAFHFFGSDTSLDGGSSASVLAHLKRRIPVALRSRFHFHGSQPREQLLQSLATFSIAVVPSRWENLPYTCIEAMATGLPVLISPNGGMRELIADGDSGWIARDGSPDALAHALTRALATTPRQRAAMGARAAAAVRGVCASNVVVSRHLQHRDRVLRDKSSRLKTAVSAASPEPGPQGIGCIVTCAYAPQRAASVLASIQSQTQPMPCVLVLDAALHPGTPWPRKGVDHVVYLENFSPESAARRGFTELLARWPQLQAVAILDQTMRLATSFATACEAALLHQLSAALVVPWALYDQSHLDAGSIPLAAPALHPGNLPYGCAIRITAVLSPASRQWNTVMYPQTLLFFDRPFPVSQSPARRYSGMALIQNPSASFAFAWFLAAPLREKARWIGRIVLHPGRILRWVGWQLRHSVPELPSARTLLGRIISPATPNIEEPQPNNTLYVTR